MAGALRWARWTGGTPPPPRLDHGGGLAADWAGAPAADGAKCTALSLHCNLPPAGNVSSFGNLLHLTMSPALAVMCCGLFMAFNSLFAGVLVKVGGRLSRGCPPASRGSAARRGPSCQPAVHAGAARGPAAPRLGGAAAGRPAALARRAHLLPACFLLLVLPSLLLPGVGPVCHLAPLGCLHLPLLPHHQRLGGSHLLRPGHRLRRPRAGAGRSKGPGGGAAGRAAGGHASQRLRLRQRAQGRAAGTLRGPFKKLPSNCPLPSLPLPRGSDVPPHRHLRRGGAGVRADGRLLLPAHPAGLLPAPGKRCPAWPCAQRSAAAQQRCGGACPERGVPGRTQRGGMQAAAPWGCTA